MNEFTFRALLSFVHAFITCGFLSLFLKKSKMTSTLKIIIIFTVYTLLSLLMSSGMQGIAAITSDSFDTIQFVLYTVAGIGACAVIYINYNRHILAEKIHAKKNKK